MIVQISLVFSILIVMMSFYKPYSDRVKGAVADCGYYSIHKQTQYAIADKMGAVLAAILLYLSVLLNDSKPDVKTPRSSGSPVILIVLPIKKTSIIMEMRSVNCIYI